MSIIGPRASEWDAVNTFLPDEIDKMKVRPGITGLSQVWLQILLIEWQFLIRSYWIKCVLRRMELF